MSLSNQSRVKALVSTVDFRVQSTVSWEVYSIALPRNKYCMPNYFIKRNIWIAIITFYWWPIFFLMITGFNKSW